MTSLAEIAVFSDDVAAASGFYRDGRLVELAQA